MSVRAQDAISDFDTLFVWRNGSLFICDQILQRVLKGCSQSMLCSLSLTACQFMEEPGTAVQVRESKHPYDNNTSFEVGKKPVCVASPSLLN